MTTTRNYIPARSPTRHLPVARAAAVALVALLAALGAGGCASDSAVLGQANQFHGQLQPAVIEDPTLSNYLQRVGDRIVEGAVEYNRDHEGGAKAHRTGGDNAWMYRDVR